jgi:5-methylcytosine-specific restriction endonuclease McrA
MIQKEKTALGYLTSEQLSLNVGGMTVRERLHVVQGGELRILKGIPGSNTGVSLYDLAIGTSDTTDFISLINISNKLVIPIRFQRNFVKTIPEQQSIMRAILRNELLNPLYFSQIELKNIIEIIDGQQRHGTLIKFTNSEFPLGPDTIVDGIIRSKKINLSGLTYKQIEEELPNGDTLLQTLYSQIYLSVILYSGTETQIRQQYMNLNEGQTGLNNMEKTLAYESKLYEYVRERNNNGNFDKVGIETNRFTAADLMLKMYYYHLKGPKKVTVADQRSLKDERISKRFKKTVDDVIKFIDAIPETAISEFGKGNIRLLFWILINLRKEYDVLITDYNLFFKFIQKMYTDITIQKGMVDTVEGPRRWFHEMVRRDSASEQIGLTNETNLYIDLKLKETNDLAKFAELYGIQLRQFARNISIPQRWEVLLKQDRICPHCNQIVNLGDDAHHIVHYAVGGDNSIDNCVILHKQCHIELHKNDTPVDSSNIDIIEDDETQN